MDMIQKIILFASRFKGGRNNTEPVSTPIECNAEGALKVEIVEGTGVRPVAGGGTGQATLTDGAFVIGNGTSPVSQVGPGTAGQIPISQGAGNDPVMTALSSDVTMTSGGAVTIANNAVTNAKIANSTIDLTAKVTGVLPAANGGTAQSTYAKGDTLYASATNTLSKLAIGTGRKRATIATDIPAWEYDWVYSTTNGTVGIADNLKFFNLDATGNITLNLTAAATLGAGHVFGVRKSDSTSGTLTIDANSTETIDGATTFVLYRQYDYAIIMCTGSAFVILDKYRSPPAFSAYKSGAQTITAGATTKVSLDAESFDTHGWFDSSTNYRFTPLIAGKYHFSFNVGLSSFGSAKKMDPRLWFNAATDLALGVSMATGAAADCSGGGSKLVAMNGSTDFIELRVTNGDVSDRAVTAALHVTYLTGHWVEE